MSGAALPAASFEIFLAGVEQRAFRRARIATGDDGEALDLVRDAMLKLARGHALRPAAEWPVLFQQILVNRIRDWHRSQALRQRMMFWRSAAANAPAEDEDPLDVIDDPAAAGNEARLAGEQAGRLLEEAIGTLPLRQREALELRVWEGLDVERTAAAMGCSASSVKTLLPRALALLRMRLTS